MPDKQLSALSAVTSLDDADLLFVSQGGNSRKGTVAQLRTNVGSAWALAGTGQTATGVYDFAVDGAKSNIDFVGLSSFNELLLTAKGISYGSSVSRLVQVSVDNGGTWFTASGDYITVDNAGVETAATGFTLHNTATASARTVILHIKNLKGTIKKAQRQATDANVLFVGSTSNINAIRFTNSGGANTTAGKVYVEAR